MNIKKSQDDDWIIHFQNRISKFGNKYTVSQHGDFEGNGIPFGSFKILSTKRKTFFCVASFTYFYLYYCKQITVI